MATVHDVAAYILESQGAMSPMKLQKLVYYSQAWSLVWDDRPLFDDPIEAWVYGPVVDALYQLHKGNYQVEKWPEGDSGNMTQDERETVDAVLASYGGLSAFQLSDLTHKEEPWMEAREGLPAGAFSTAKIKVETMHRFYSAQFWE